MMIKLARGRTPTIQVLVKSRILKLTDNVPISDVIRDEQCGTLVEFPWLMPTNA